MADILIRFFIGGLMVTVFAALGDVFQPKSFAGLFGAAPSIALATLGITILQHGRSYAAVEARSMMAGAAALAVYAASTSWILRRYKAPVLLVTLALLPLWLGVSFGILHVCLR
jgi:Protein of unknown function (DUF3147)